MYRGRDQAPRGGAEHLARIHGTEEDKVNCPFYFKIGACRHGDKCSRHHNKPPFSQTIIVPHMWPNPMVPVANAGGDLNSIDHKAVQEEFDDFFAEIFEEFHRFGTIEEIDVCENLGDHLVGNVYVKYEDEEFADAALKVMNGRFYAGRPLTCEFSPVTDFREARCRQYDDGNCDRGPFCNFMHVRQPGRELKDFLEKEYKFIMLKPKFGPGGGGGRGGGGGGGSYDRRGGNNYDRGGGRPADSHQRSRSRERRDRSRDRDRDRDRRRDSRDRRDDRPRDDRRRDEAPVDTRPKPPQ